MAFAVSLVCALVVWVPARAPVDRPGRSGILSGVHAIWRDPMLRAATVLVAAANTVGAPLMLVATVILKRQAVQPLFIGVALAGLAVGGLVGAALVGPLHRRLRPGVLLIGFVTILAPLVAALGIPWGPWWMAAVLMCAGLGMPAM